MLICSDSQSTLAALNTGPLRQRERALEIIWDKLLDLTSPTPNSPGLRIHLQFVYSHCGLPCNDRVDKLAGLALDYIHSYKPADPTQRWLTDVMTKCWSYFRSRRLLNFTDEARIGFARDALVPPKWRNMEPGGVRRKEVWFARLRTGELTEHGRFPRRMGVYGNMDCRWCCPDTSILRLLPNAQDNNSAQDTSEAPLSLGAFIQYFRDYVTLHGPSDELRPEAQREIILVPPHERITYRICPYCVENRRPRFTQKGGIMELRRHVMSCSRRSWPPNVYNHCPD